MPGPGGAGRCFSDGTSCRRLSAMSQGSSLSVPRLSWSVLPPELPLHSPRSPAMLAACLLLPLQVRSLSCEPSPSTLNSHVLSPLLGTSLACIGSAAESWSCESKKNLKSWMGSTFTLLLTKVVRLSPGGLSGSAGEASGASAQVLIPGPWDPAPR